MIQFDLGNYDSKWHHLEYKLYLGALLDMLQVHYELYPDDVKMADCIHAILVFYEEILIDDGGDMMKPVAIKVFDNQIEALEWSVKEGSQVLLSELHQQEELIFVEEYETVFPYTTIFESKKEAEEWIIQEEEKIELAKKMFFTNLEENSSFNDYDYHEKPVAAFELKKYEGNLYIVYRFDKMKTNNGYLFYGKDQFQNWLNQNQQNIHEKHLSITYRPRKEDSVYYYYKIFSYEPLVVNPYEISWTEMPLFFLLHYNFQDFIRTNEWLEYHLKHSFKNDFYAFKTYLEDALIGFEDRMTFHEKHLRKLKNYIENRFVNVTKDAPIFDSTIPESVEDKQYLGQNLIDSDKIQTDLEWQGTTETEFVQFAYSLFYSKILINKSNQITKFLPSLAKAFNFTLGKYWESNHSKSIKKTNNDYQPQIFEKLKNGYEKYADTIKNKKK